MKKRVLSAFLALVLFASMSVSAYAAEPETKNIKITAKYSKTVTYSYTLPNVSKTETLPTASKEDKDKWAAFSNGFSSAGNDVTVYTIKNGEKIYLKDVLDFWVCRMVYKDGELSGPDDSKLDYSKIYKSNLKDTKTKIAFGNGAGAEYQGGSDKTYMTFTKTGYYAFMPYPGWSPYGGKVGAEVVGLKEGKVTYNPKHGGVVIRVVD